MRIHPTLLAVFVLLIAAASASARDDKSEILGFETGRPAGWLKDWYEVGAGGETAIALDSAVVHGGRYAARLERTTSSPGQFTAMATSVRVDFAGDSLELRGWVRYEGVTDFVGLWQRQDGRAGPVRFDNMRSRKLAGTSEWRELRLVLPLDPKADSVAVGALLVGTGRLWVDDLRLLVDGKPLATAPDRVVAKTILDVDHDFDGGSRISIDRLSPVQVENLRTLGKVWGFLKYHHPRVVDGTRQWDFDLFRILPRILSATDRDAANRAMAAWVAALGEPPPCRNCAPSPEGGPVVPRLGWLSDSSLLGPDLSGRLRRIYERRETRRESFYVGFFTGVGNPEFSRELPYAGSAVPDTGYRLLALFRFWNIVEYWSPYRDLTGEDWDEVLREFIPRVVAAESSDAYALTMIALFARLHDGHANLFGVSGIRPPRGSCQIPVTLRFAESRLVVTGYSNPSLGPATGLRVGDVIAAFDGVPVDSLVARWRPFYPASNEAARLRDVALLIGRGACDSARLTIERPDSVWDLTVARAPSGAVDPAAGRTHDHPGETMRRVSDDVAYLKLSSFKQEEVAEYLRKAKGAKCLVIDIRNYPSEFAVFALGEHLIEKRTPFATFTTADPSNPGAFSYSDRPMSLEPSAPRFEGKVAILVDETSQSQAEYTAMAFRAAPGAIVVGSTTAGADGNVSEITLPGNLRGLMSGIGVFYPDRRPTQRIGIVPDVVVRPTIAGIRAGRDEVLEAAIARLLGRGMSDGERRALDATGPATTTDR